MEEGESRPMPSRMEGVKAVDGAAGERKGNCEKGDRLG
jgi:hypothetical protein